jgi:ataxia telangiectasia mutated family protein
MRKSSCPDDIKLSFIEARLLHAKSDLKRSKFLLKNSIENFESTFLQKESQADESNSIDYYLKSVDLYAQLLNETKSENPTVIIRNLLEKSLVYIEKFNLDTKPEKLDLIVDSFYSLAKFADAQYQSICEYIKSKSFEEHSELMRQFQIEKTKTQSIEPEGYFYRLLDKQYQLDREDMTVLLENREEYLCKAIKYYLNCLELGQVVSCEKNCESSLQSDNFSIFRLISLWTQNSNNQNVNKTVEKKIFRIGTYKFLILMHQISARISLKALNCSSKDDDDSDDERLFQQILINLITNISKDHPHHSLPILLAFQNANKDYFVSNSTVGSSSKTRSDDRDMNAYLMTQDRVSTASHIINTLKTSSPQLKAIIESMAILCDAYIELANAQVTQKPKSNESITFPKNLLINKVKNFQNTGIITNQIPISPTGHYEDSNIVYIVKFDSKFRLANGVNLPKIVHCYGSDGIGRKQLVKGKDDLRQDAVMQQFFATVNDLINFNNRSQNTTKLNNIRTYKIVPLSKKSGVLEWCQNTITLGNQSSYFIKLIQISFFL